MLTSYKTTYTEQRTPEKGILICQSHNASRLERDQTHSYFKISTLSYDAYEAEVFPKIQWPVSCNKFPILQKSKFLYRFRKTSPPSPILQLKPSSSNSHHHILLVHKIQYPSTHACRKGSLTFKFSTKKYVHISYLDRVSAT